MKIAVVLIGYNRPEAMARLTKSVCQADYSMIEQVDLVLSLDHSNKQEEQALAFEQVDWPHGEKVLRAFPERQGLRNHVLQCGDLTEKYDAIVALEDDLVVAKGYMDFVVQAIRFYDHDDAIAGISLYTHRTNPGNGRYFEAVHNGFDAYLKQYAQSWGQCWTRKMWKAFRAWYAERDELVDCVEVPDYVREWSNQSWLKYYITYTAQTNRYFVYPYIALSTNASDIGEHCKFVNNDYQVPLSQGTMQYRFPQVEQAVKYDAFFERVFDKNEWLASVEGKKLLDLYGLRTNFGDADVLVSTQMLNYRILASYSLKYRPQEVNCQLCETGDDIFAYDLHTPDQNKIDNRAAVGRYDIKALSWHSTLQHGLLGLKKAIATRLPGMKKRK